MSGKNLDGEVKEEKKHSNLVVMPGKESEGAIEEASAATRKERKAKAKSKSNKSAKKVLCDAVKHEVMQRSRKIAHDLVDKVTKGDARGTEVVLTLLQKARQENNAKKARKRSGPSWAELLVSEPEWDENMEDGGSELKAG
jgi:hypothetical protein